MLQFLPRGVFPEPRRPAPLLPEETPRRFRILPPQHEDVDPLQFHTRFGRRGSLRQVRGQAPPEGPGYVPQAFRADGNFGQGERTMTDRRREAFDEMVDRSLAVQRGRAPMQSDDRSFLRREVVDPFLASDFGQMVTAPLGDDVRSRLGVPSRAVRAPERFVQGLEVGPRGVARLLSAGAPDGSIAQQQAEDYLRTTDDSTDPTPLPPSSHPIAVIAQGAGTMLPTLLTGGAGAAAGFPALGIMALSTGTAFPAMYEESVNGLMEGGASREEAERTAAVPAMINSVFEAVVPMTIGARVVRGPAVQRTLRQFAQRTLAEGVEEGITESSQGVVNTLTDAIVNDNPLVPYEMAEQAAHDFYAGFLTASTVSGGISGMQAAGPRAGEAFVATAARVIEDESGQIAPGGDPQPVYDEAEAREHFGKFDEEQSNVSWEEVEAVLPEIMEDESVFDKPIIERNAEDAQRRGEEPMTRTQIAVAEAIDRLSRPKGMELREQDRLAAQEPPGAPETADELDGFDQTSPRMQAAISSLVNDTTETVSVVEALPSWAFEEIQTELGQNGVKILQGLRESAPKRYRAILQQLVVGDAMRTGTVQQPDGFGTLATDQRLRALLNNTEPAAPTNPPTPMTEQQAQEAVEGQQAATRSPEQMAAELQRKGWTGPAASRVAAQSRVLATTRGDQVSELHNTKPLHSRGTTTKDGRPASTARFVFSPYSDRELTAPGVEVESSTWARYRSANRDLLSQPNHFLGTWTPDPENEPGYIGRTVYDVSVAASDPREVAKLLRQHNQEAAFDIQTGQTLTADQLDALADEQDAREVERGEAPAAPADVQAETSVRDLAKQGRLTTELHDSRSALDESVQALGIAGRVRDKGQGLERSDLKASNERRIGKRIADLFSDQEIREAAGAAHGSVARDPFPNDSAASIGQRLADTFMGSWANSAADNQPESLALQYAANELLGGAGKTDHFLRPVDDPDVAALMPAARIFVEAMYAETQAMLENAGYGPGDPVTLLRGASFRPGDTSYGAGDFQFMQPLNSFTSEADVALNGFTGGNGVLLVASIPRRNIIGSTMSGCGCLIEGEYIVGGGQYAPEVVHTELVGVGRPLSKNNVQLDVRDWINERADIRERTWDHMTDQWKRWDQTRTVNVIERLMDAVHGGVGWATDPAIKKRLLAEEINNEETRRQAVLTARSEAYRRAGITIGSPLLQGEKEAIAEEMALLLEMDQAEVEPFVSGRKVPTDEVNDDVIAKWAPISRVIPDEVVNYAADNIDPDFDTFSLIELTYTAAGRIDDPLLAITGMHGTGPRLVPEDADPVGEIVQRTIAKGED